MPVDEPATVLMSRAERPRPHPPANLQPDSPAQQTADTDMLVGKETRMEDLSGAVLSAGDRVGPYVVDRVIGSGGMGVVVAARHEGLNDRVAIKVLRPKAASDQVHAERFAREARAIVKIRSEHVVRVLDAGAPEGGAPYIVMEYLVGRDLARILREEGPLPVARAVPLMLQICEAVASAHAVGVIHRDLKPSNFFVTSTNDVVKVLDFGIAKAIGQEGIADPNLTETQAVFGSPTYMSPEQIRSAKHVDQRSDIWSLGVAFYELLTGKLPFAADNVAGLLASIIADPPFFPRAFVPELPAALEALLLECLAKDTRERVQSAPELAFRLSAFVPPSPAIRTLLDRIDGLARVMNVSIAPRPAPSARVSRPDAMMVLPTAPPPSTHGTLGSTTFGSTGMDLAAVAPRRGGMVAAAALGGGLVAILVLVGVIGALQLRKPAEPTLGAPSAMTPEPALSQTIPMPEPSATQATASSAPSAVPSTAPSARPRGGHPRPHPGGRPPGAPKSADPTSDRY